MQVTAKVKNLHIAPKKVRLVADLVRGKKAVEAMQQLRFTNKKSSLPVSELIKSAIANAEHNYNLSADNLFIKTITVDQGLTLKRYTPRAFGRATLIRKKMSHIALVLEEIEPTGDKKGKRPAKGKKTTVDSLDKIKTTKEVVEKNEKQKPDEGSDVPPKLENEKKERMQDPAMEGKHRYQKDSDKGTMKEKGGVKKKHTRQKRAV